MDRFPSHQDECHICKVKKEVYTFEVIAPLYVTVCKECLKAHPNVLNVGTTIWKNCCGN